MKKRIIRKQVETKAEVSKIAAKRLRIELHLGMTLEDWRSKKRGEWKSVMHALDRFGFGCAYTPASNDLHELQRSAQRIADAMDSDWLPL